MNVQEIKNKVEEIEGFFKYGGIFELSPGVFIAESDVFLSALKDAYDHHEYPSSPGRPGYEEKEFQLFQDVKNGIYKYWLSTDDGINIGYHRIIDILACNDWSQNKLKAA